MNPPDDDRHNVSDERDLDDGPERRADDRRRGDVRLRHPFFTQFRVGWGLVFVVLLVSAVTALFVLLRVGAETPEVVWSATADEPLSQEWATWSCVSASRITQPTTIGGEPVPYHEHAYRFELRDGDEPVGGRERCEISTSHSSTIPGTTQTKGERVWNEGDEAWVAYAVRLDGSWVATSGSNNVFTQFKGEGDGGAPLHMAGTGGKLRLSRATSAEPSNSARATVWEAPAIKDRWLRFVYHVKFSSSSSLGFVELFGDLDGQGIKLLKAKTFAHTMKSGRKSRLVVGEYRDNSINGTGFVSFSGITVATNRAAAEEQAFGDITAHPPTTTEPPPTTTVPPSTTTTQPPELGLTATMSRPAHEATIKGRVPWACTTNRDASIDRVEFAVDGAVLFTERAAPWEPVTSGNVPAWDSTSVADGHHVLSCEAFTDGGARVHASAVVTVANGAAAPPDPPPAPDSFTARVVAPLSNATVRGRVPWECETTRNAFVDRVEFFVDGVLKFTERSHPWHPVVSSTPAWDSATVADGSHVLRCVATSTGGVETDAGVTVTVANGAAAPPPPEEAPPPPSEGSVILSPGANIAATLDSAKPGDVIQLRPGAYSGEIDSGVDGTAAEPIVLEAVPGRSATLHSKLTLTGASHLRISGLVFEGHSSVSGTAVRIDGGSRHVVFDGNEVRDYRLSPSSKVQAFLIGGSSAPGDDIVLRGNHIHDNGVTNRFDHGIYCQNASRLRVLDNLIENQNRGYGIQFYTGYSGGRGCDDAEVRGNMIVDSQLSGIVIGTGTDRATVADNIFKDHATTSDGASGYALRQGTSTGSGTRVTDNEGIDNGRSEDFVCSACALSGNVSR